MNNYNKFTAAGNWHHINISKTEVEHLCIPLPVEIKAALNIVWPIFDCVARKSFA